MTKIAFMKLLQDLERDICKVIDIAAEDKEPSNTVLKISSIIGISAGRIQGALAMFKVK